MPKESFHKYVSTVKQIGILYDNALYIEIFCAAKQKQMKNYCDTFILR